MNNAPPISYRPLALAECEKIKEIDASQLIKNAWREVNGQRQLIAINYHDPDFPEGYENHLAALQEIVTHGGIAQGAFCGPQLVGFCGVDTRLFGQAHQYALLGQLFISRPFRGKGIGKALFHLSAQAAKAQGADKFYICAGSAEETIAFYFALGCVEAVEINQALYEADPRDYQLEYRFSLAG